MPAHILGPGLILAFVVTQALRDVYLAHIFRDIDVFATIFAAFLLMRNTNGGPGYVAGRNQQHCGCH